MIRCNEIDPALVNPPNEVLGAALSCCVDQSRRQLQ
jgi:hypothetical protein